MQEIINQITSTIQNSTHPELFYLGGAVLLVLLLYVVNKVIKVAIFLGIIAVFLIGYTQFQGKDINEVLQPVLDSANNFISSITKKASSIGGAAEEAEQLLDNGK